MEKMRKYLLRNNKYDIWVGFLLSFGILFMISMKDNVRAFMVDSIYYWDIGNRVWFDEVNELRGFNILAFPETFRGYFWPVLLCTMKAFGKLCGIDVYVLYRILSSMLFSCFIAVVLPYLFGLFEKYLPVYKYIIGVIAVTLFTACFWKRFMEYPFSDAAAMIFFMCGCSIAKSILLQFEREEWKITKFFIKAFLLGILLYGAYSTRLIYLYGDVVLIICLLIGLSKVVLKRQESDETRIKIRTLVLVLIFGLLGTGMAAYPQMLINHKYIGNYSPRVPSEQLSGYSQSLVSAHVNGGFCSERLDGVYIGDSINGYPMVEGVLYRDRSGEQVAKEASEDIGFNKKTSGIGDVITIYLQYPFDIIGIYTRHILSNITLLYDDWLIYEIGEIDKFDMLLNMLLWIMGGVALAASKWSIKAIWEKRFLLCVVIPCILVIVGLPETRLFIPLYYILYGYIAYGIDYTALKGYVRKHLLKIIVASGMVFCIWCMYIGNLLDIVDRGTYLIK